MVPGAVALATRTEVVPDVGIDLRALGGEWTKAVAALQVSRRADDINELPDEADVQLGSER